MSELDVLLPQTAYACTKAAFTQLSRMYYALNIRPFSVYGPQEKDTRFIPTVIRSCITQEPMILDPNAKHDWIFCDDLIDGMILMSLKYQLLKGTSVNLGTGIQTDNRTVVDIIEELTGKKANIIKTLELRKGDSPDWRADITRAKDLGWAPKTNIVRGLEKTVKFYEDRYRT